MLGPKTQLLNAPRRRAPAVGEIAENNKDGLPTEAQNKLKVKAKTRIRY